MYASSSLLIQMIQASIIRNSSRHSHRDFSSLFLAGLKEKFAEAMRRDDVKAIVLTGFVW
ncbi:putative isomerase, Enoyl-CoA hydratase, 3-hydroxyacyl-CoA dehydrogenase [Helianthus annuus]|nr:putative isomerase, Enoyl-CoA hydratase, 3-hydroxyacyl-CoA dehydrogenase [Helianthus annuus]